MQADEAPADEWIAALHAELAPSLERIAWSILRDWGLAADATQEAFLALATRAAEVEPEYRRGWLVRAVQLQAHNLRRKQQRQSPLEARREELAGLPQGCPVEHAEELAWLRQAIDRLPIEQREVLQARLVDEQTFAQIAENKELPLGTVLSRMRLAVQRLRKELESYTKDADDHATDIGL